MERRAVLKGLGLVAIAAPVAAVRELVKADPPPDLPELGQNAILTSEHYSALTRRVNELSRVAR